MNVELITKEDLKNLKTDILNEIRQLIRPGQSENRQCFKRKCSGTDQL